MNENTRVAICCYTGDQDRVIANFEMYQHHKCPIVVISPKDAKAWESPDHDSRFSGLSAYTGQKALDMWREHLKTLLTFPENFFLLHEADSMCLEPKLPDYLYAEPDIFWVNLVDNCIPQQQEFYPEGFPRVAFQPPWFLSRKTITALLAVVDDVTPNLNMLYDYWLVQLAVKAKLQWRGLPGAISYPTAEPFWAGAAWDAVRHRGVTFVHAIKTHDVCTQLRAARRSFLHGGEHWNSTVRNTKTGKRA